MQNIAFSKNELKEIQTQEAQLVKQSLGLLTRTRDTKLLYVLGIDPIEIRDTSSKSVPLSVPLFAFYENYIAY
jgi:hypothetical protein